MKKHISLENFYMNIGATIPSDISKEIGHFNIFNIAEVTRKLMNNKAYMPIFVYLLIPLFITNFNQLWQTESHW